ncbi:hypothetical protein RUND412_008020 [Rhizina undulata]
MKVLTSAGALSRRGAATVANGERMNTLIDFLSNAYDPETNPTGVISLGVAENAHMHEELVEFANKNLKIDEHTLTYGEGPFGSERLRAALSVFLNEHFNPAEPVHQEQIIVSAGVTSTSDLLAWVLTDAGDGILLGAPFYGAFVNDFRTRSSAAVVPVYFDGIDPFSIDAIDRYEAALLKSQQSRTPIRALVIINPHNPLGKCYNRETLVALLKFCQKHRIHLISDEIYALTVFKNKEYPDAVTFTSVLSIDLEGIIDKELVHVLYGMSKDFCANGFRIGACITQHNKNLILGLRAVSMFGWPSGPSDLLSALILESCAFIDPFIAKNQQRLGESYEIVTTFLKERGIDYYKGGNAGVFIWVDLRFALPPPSDDLTTDVARERALAQKFVDAGLYISTGEDFFSQESGWFRIIFSQPKDLLLAGLGRLAAVVGRL